MSLLLNEEFTLYRLRLGYLSQTHDGVDERLINLNTAVLNEPAFRAAGWTQDAAAIKRCYSPPIPTTGAAEYFNRPKERRRRKQGHKMEEDDSSDLSDDSDEEDTAAQSVRFARVPRRGRSSNSPARQSTATLKPEGAGPEVKVTSPSYKTRTSSLGATEAINAANARTGTRPRRDTTTSSEMSSDNEGLGPETVFRRRLPSRPQRSALLSEKISEEGPDDDSELEDEDEEDDVEVAEASDLSDEFEGDDVAAPSPENPIDVALGGSLERKPSPVSPPDSMPSHIPPKKLSKEDLPKLPKLPPGRPMSKAPPPSLLSMALRGPGGNESSEKPYQKYAELSGKGEAQPLWIKIYAPFSKVADEPIQVPLRRSKDAEGGVPTVNELIGLALFRYDEVEYKPALSERQGKLENWELRMVEDGEVDMDFPALSRNRPVTDFTSNNNRPPQRRMRDKPWDEFGLVAAEGVESESEDEATSAAQLKPTPKPSAAPSVDAALMPPPAAPGMLPNRNPITGPSFALNAAMRKDSTNLLDTPQTQATTSTPRMGPVKTVSLHFTDPQSFQTTVLPLDATADTYIAELFDQACARLRLDKALYVLKVRHTQTETGLVVQGSGKTTNVPMSSIVGVKVSRKHPKMMRVLVYREKETKRYDFECASHAEAEAVVADIRVGLSEYGVGGDE
ncbi:Component of a membrane-bound complex containing the Tor2p kinase [Rachicladosporium monterosium]|uniref:Component of a membrane-bound complex containing the Tor2p kinase n=1 Tax=Rachicladosporium monterosium TaxID=1507873 RepID=A0ABR0LFZ0_9PEZI|nr:Component of a membrane-bound complex containing the Tor2p kinase [Rachicladosporium monterosium]